MWTNFKDLFESLIADNVTLTNVQRLHYLKLSLSDEAELLLKNVVVNENNYASAWQTLKDRYDNKRSSSRLVRFEGRRYGYSKRFEKFA